MTIYALCRKIDFVENLRVFGVKIWTEISIRVKNLTFSMSVAAGAFWGVAGVLVLGAGGAFFA